VPLALLGGDDGDFNYGIVTGAFAIEPTDRAPNDATPAASGEPFAIPAPPGAILLAVGALSLLGYRHRRKLV
jgi:hypothetical protein